MQNSLHTTRVRRKWKLDPRLNFAGKRKEIARIIFIANRIRTLTSRKPSNLTSFFKTIFLESTFSSISFLKTKERKRRGKRKKTNYFFRKTFRRVFSRTSAFLGRIRARYTSSSCRRCRSMCFVYLDAQMCVRSWQKSRNEEGTRERKRELYAL